MASKAAGLRTAPSLESCDTQENFVGSPTRKRKAPTDTNALTFKRTCDSPPDWDSSSVDCGSNQAWASPEDIDLVASDSLDEDLDDDGDTSFPASQPSSTSSQDWTFLQNGPDSPRSGLELASPVHTVCASDMTDSPVKSGYFAPREWPASSLVAHTASQYQFSPLVIGVGTSYFQRLASEDPALKKAALRSRDFAQFVLGIPDMPPRNVKSVGAPLHQCQSPQHWLLAVHLTCIYIAAKNLEQVQYKHLLRTMLQRLHGPFIRPEHAERLEIEVLTALDWRMGPFYLHRDL